MQTAIVGLADDAGADSVRRFADIIAAFRGPARAMPDPE